MNNTDGPLGPAPDGNWIIDVVFVVIALGFGPVVAVGFVQCTYVCVGRRMACWRRCCKRHWPLWANEDDGSMTQARDTVFVVRTC